MKVNNDANSSIQGLQTTKANSAHKKEKVEKNPKDIASSLEARGSSAQVDLSDRAQALKKLKELAQAAPDVNAEKVKRFQELIDKGHYKTDSKKIAEKMIEEHLHSAASSEE